MRTDLTDEEHVLLSIVAFYDPYTTIKENMNYLTSSLIDRSLIRAEFGDNSEIRLRLTDDGALLARIYGEP